MGFGRRVIVFEVGLCWCMCYSGLCDICGLRDRCVFLCVSEWKQRCKQTAVTWPDQDRQKNWEVYSSSTGSSPLKECLGLPSVRSKRHKAPWCSLDALFHALSLRLLPRRHVWRRRCLVSWASYARVFYFVFLFLFFFSFAWLCPWCAACRSSRPVYLWPCTLKKRSVEGATAF